MPPLGAQAVREAVRWPTVDRGGRLDLAEVRRLARAGRAAGVTQLWDLMHYGYPDDVAPFSNLFVERFARYCGEVAECCARRRRGPSTLRPSTKSLTTPGPGRGRLHGPFGRGRGGDLKRQLVRAAVQGMNAVWRVDPDAVALSVDPLVRQHAPAGRPDLAEGAAFFNEHVVFEAFDLLAGRLEPELGGSRRHLGVVGLNYYACNQWTVPTPEEPQRFFSPDDDRWLPLHEQLWPCNSATAARSLWPRRRVGPQRASWLERLTLEAKAAHAAGVDLQGVCLYPVITSPDWEDPTAFFDGGVFDVTPDEDGCLRRVLSPDVETALRAAQKELDPNNLPAHALAQTLEPPNRPGVASASPPKVSLLHTYRQNPTTSRTARFRWVRRCVWKPYSFAPGQGLPAHRHAETEHVWTVLAGRGRAEVGDEHVDLDTGDALLVPADVYHALHNPHRTTLTVQQVSSPKPGTPTTAGATRRHDQKRGKPCLTI